MGNNIFMKKKYWSQHPPPSCIPPDVMGTQPMTPLREEIYGLELKVDFKEVKSKNE